MQLLSRRGFEIGSYTLAPFKVCWQEIGNTIEAAVVGSSPVLPGGKPKPIIPDHKVIFIGCNEEDEANYLAGLLNSSISRFIVGGYVAISSSPHVADHIPLPRFTGGREQKAIAREAQRLARERVSGSEPDRSTIDRLAAQLWALSADDLGSIQAAVEEQASPRPEPGEERTEPDDADTEGSVENGD